jgi:hypothetical protein
VRLAASMTVSVFKTDQVREVTVETVRGRRLRRDG